MSDLAYNLARRRSGNRARDAAPSKRRANGNTTAEAMSESLIGKVVNGYEILSQVGQGGMATVFLARQRSMNRNVALKFLPNAFMNDAAYLQRFEREVRIVAQLEHRNIVPVYDFGEFEDQPYIAMRYMPAGSVEELLAAGRIPLGRVLSIVEQVASALDYAHQNGILHRDLKPSNILLDDGGGVFITDFGIARILGEGGSNITTQGVVGTPSYMSPEQARGEALDGRSDVYSLGVMLFELITGRRPFDSETPYSIAVMHVTMPPPAPSDVEPSVTDAVEAVILRALHKQPDKRYATAGDLARALRLAADLPAARPDDPAGAARPDTPAPRSTLAAPDAAPNNSQDTSRNVKLRFTRRLAPIGRARKAWVGAAAGGGIGCLMLAVLLVAAVSLLGGISDDSAATAPATHNAAVSVDATATAVAATATAVAATESPPPAQARAGAALNATLAALAAAADATFTAEVELRPTATRVIIQPVGLRKRPTLLPSLAGRQRRPGLFRQTRIQRRKPAGIRDCCVELVDLGGAALRRRRQQHLPASVAGRTLDRLSIRPRRRFRNLRRQSAWRPIAAVDP